MAHAGCAQLAGIDETTGGTPPGPGVSLTVERVSIGATVVRGPQDLSASTARWLLPDVSAPGGFTPITGTLVPPNTWHAEINNATPPVQFDLPDLPAPQLRLYEFPHADLKTAFTVLEHPNPTPPPASAMITVSATLDAPYNGEGLQLFTVGTWASRGLVPPIAGATALNPPPFLYASMVSQTGRPLEKLTTADAVFVFRYLGNQLVGMLDVPPFEQTGMDTVSGTLVTLPLNQSLDARVDQAAVARRLTAVRPAVGAPTMSWSLRAAPGYQFGIDNGPLLHSAAVLAGDPTTITAAYANPFLTRDWKTLLTWSTRATRSYTIPALALPVTLTAGMFQRAEPAPALALALPAGLPELISIDGRPLSTDGVTIAQPTAPVVVTFVTDVPQNTLYQLELVELAPNMAGTAIQQRIVLTVFAPTPELKVPVDAFEPGTHYTIRAITVKGGYPGVETGDLAARDLPVAVSFLDSGVFQVMP
ncbi:MAG: hypothetical protein H0T89_02030 [Deltaproteobacteria bacterium]|nr:hypothetical protein [Deltaproteobacteria bacterium]MDQ3301208.1 hypothetical protein [Myxococcota bacterium]